MMKKKMTMMKEIMVICEGRVEDGNINLKWFYNLERFNSITLTIILCKIETLDFLFKKFEGKSWELFWSSLLSKIKYKN